MYYSMRGEGSGIGGKEGGRVGSYKCYTVQKR